MTESFETAAVPTEAPVVEAPLPVLPPMREHSVTPEPVAAGTGFTAETDESSTTDTTETTETTVSEPAARPLADLQATVLRLVAESEKHHQRAAHRESVIDNLHAELEKVRTGERRGTVRPLLAAVARLRNDLVEQALGLPGDFDATRAQKLLQSFADSIEITLEDFGVAAYRPKAGDDFDPRRQRAVSSEPTSDAESVRKVASVRKDGYQDIEAGVTLAQAEVTVYVAAPDPAAKASSAGASDPSAPVIDEPLIAVPTGDSAEAPPATTETATTPSVH